MATRRAARAPGAWLQVAADPQRDGRHAAARPPAGPRRARRRRPPSRRRRRRRDTDDRLALLFACCHPALAPEARLALTLRAVVGLTTPQIARAFLVNETTLAQRIVRAKRKIVSAGIALTVPPESELARAARATCWPSSTSCSTRASCPRPGPRRTATWPPTRSGSPASSPPRCPARPRPGAWPRCSPSSTPAAGPGSPTATWCCCATRTAACGTRRRSPRASG